MGVVVRDRSLFIRLLLPGLLISIGAGQVSRCLNCRPAQVRPGPRVAHALSRSPSLGTVAAMLAQPALARRFGQISSVVIVQALSIPFLFVLGFSPILWTVIAAMSDRNSLMNAGNPISARSAMEQVTPAERATLAAAMSVLWQVGWVVAEPGTRCCRPPSDRRRVRGELLHRHRPLHVATILYWVWFRAADRRALAERRSAV